MGGNAGIARGRIRGDDTIAAVLPVAADEPFWRAYLAPLLAPEGVGPYLGLGSVREVRRLTEQNKPLAVPTAAGLLYPVFQFIAGGTDPTISRLVDILAEVVATPYTTASWLNGAQPEFLEGKTPLECLASGGDPERVIAAADLVAARLDR